MRLLACLIVAPQRGYDEPAILSYAISSFCPTSADGLQVRRACGQSFLCRRGRCGPFHPMPLTSRVCLRPPALAGATRSLKSERTDPACGQNSLSASQALPAAHPLEAVCDRSPMFVGFLALVRISIVGGFTKLLRGPNAPTAAAAAGSSTLTLHGAFGSRHHVSGR